MTATGDAGPFPAPGSAVPGAPPPLKRPLTPADGVVVAAAPPTSATSPTGGASQDFPRIGAGEDGARVRAPQLTAAAAMIGVAAGLELAGVLARITAGRRRSKGVKC
ncbi:hypothetical protein E4P42_23630 [Mycobacterium sp. PS03-16]|uniref:hypothetical protein n=1 Tax=Mycobacterium sp. PS03-16 TaxID=2559611 RepID=UPI0010735A6D|nr:hypothetical protein [Mycobacterium sp. PS03-16]TFV55145.1 hypothetical protein E4P42_23630 [Mycobacterium sp. PS03-16]